MDLTEALHIHGAVDVDETFFAHAAINWFGGGTQDRLKVSCQAAGNGIVLLALSEQGDDYRPVEIRGQRVVLRYRVPDPSNPNGHSTMSLPGLELDEAGNVLVFNALRPQGFVDMGAPMAYFKGNPNHGYRWNNADDTRTDMTLDDYGDLHLHKLAGAGVRALGVDAQGRLVVL